MFKPMTLVPMLAALAVMPAIAAPCVNGLLSVQTTCQVATGSGGTFELSNWSLTDPSLTGYTISTSQFAVGGAAEIFVSFLTTANSFAITLSDNSNGTPGFDAFSATSVGGVDQQIQYKVGYAVSPLMVLGQLGNITAVGTRATGITDNGIIRGSATLQTIYAGGGVFDPTLTILETTPVADNVSLNQANTTGTSNLAVVNVVTLSARSGGGIDVTSFASTFTAATLPQPEPEPVPEPATLALVALGMAGLAATRRRRAEG